MVSPAATVHWIQPGALALTETDGHGDTCGPIVMLDVRHLAHGVPLDIPTLDASRNELISWGLMNAPGLPGMTMQQVEIAMMNHYGVVPIKTVYWSDTLPWAQVHTDIINALKAGQTVILEPRRAYNLPDNQPNVDNHYIWLCGIDSQSGYLTANGDTETALHHGGTVSPVWYTAWNLESSMPGAYMILPKIGGGNPVGAPTGWHDDGTTLTAPNGKQVVLGFRDFIMSHSWDAADEPIADQFHVDSLLIEDARWGSGDLLVCVFSVLMFADNPQGNVAPKGYIGKMPVGIEWNILRQRGNPVYTPVESAALDFARKIEGK